MHDLHPTDGNGIEKLVVRRETPCQDGSHITSIEQQIHLSDAPELPAGTMMVRRKVRRKEDGPLALCCEWVVEHQIGLAVNLLTLLGLTHLCFPRARRFTRKFFHLSYHNPESGQYTLGWDDACMVFYWLILFTGLRAGTIYYVLMPFATWGGVENKNGTVRFAEQAWMLLYCSVFWFVGMYTMYNSDYWLDLKAVWADWPNREIGGLLKWYILVQWAFWLQQILVVNIEKRRKDYAQMFLHHITTCLLLFTSFGYHQTKVANVILCLIDAVDLFLPLAKCLKHLKVRLWPNIVFGVFLVSCVLARHLGYLAVCYFVWHDIPIEILHGCYQIKKGSLAGFFPPPDNLKHLIEPLRDPEGVGCFNYRIRWAFMITLLFLQSLMVLYFCMIVQVAVKVFREAEVEDTRRDDEDEEEYEQEDVIRKNLVYIEVVPLEEEAGVEGINLKARASSSKRYKKSMSSSSGVTLPGHSDRKELLGRIGCDKGI